MEDIFQIISISSEIAAFDIFALSVSLLLGAIWIGSSIRKSEKVSCLLMLESEIRHAWNKIEDFNREIGNGPYSADDVKVISMFYFSTKRSLTRSFERAAFILPSKKSNILINSIFEMDKQYKHFDSALKEGKINARALNIFKFSIITALVEIEESVCKFHLPFWDRSVAKVIIARRKRALREISNT